MPPPTLTSRQKARAMRAVALGAVPKLARMLAGGLDPNALSARGRSLLEEAWARQRVPVFECLLAGGARPTWCLLDQVWAFENAQALPPTLSRKVEQALRADPPQISPSLRAWVRHPEGAARVRRLLDAGMAVEVRESRAASWMGSRLLTCALEAQASAVVAVLLARGASPDRNAGDDYAPLTEAACHHDVASVKALLLAGANASVRHPKSTLPLASLALIMAIPLPSDALDSYGHRWPDWTPPPAPSSPKEWADFMDVQALLLRAGASWDHEFPVEWLNDALAALQVGAAIRAEEGTMTLRAVRAHVPAPIEERWRAEEVAHALACELPEASAPSRLRL